MIMGSSGSGKSTLLNIIGLLDKHDSGKFNLFNLDVNKSSEKENALIRSVNFGFVFQNFQLIPRMNVLENILLPAKITNQYNKSVIEHAMNLLNIVNLEDYTQHYPNQLSGGQQQRVAIARALINKPTILLADEPTGSLDSNTSVEIINYLKMLNKEQGLTIIMVTHDKSYTHVANKLFHMNDGILHL